LLQWPALSRDKWAIISNASDRAYAALQKEQEQQPVQPSELFENLKRKKDHLGRVVDDQPSKARRPGLAEIQGLDDSGTARDQPKTEDEITMEDLFGDDSDDKDEFGGF